MYKISLTLGIAVACAIIGTCLINYAEKGTSIVIPFIGLIMLASIIVWSFVGYSIRKKQGGLLAAIICGIISPFIGGCIAGLPILGFGALGGIAIAGFYYYITIPVGIITGILIWAVNKPSRA